VQGISDIITIPGIINRDFADVKTTMAGMGHAVMGTAVRSGDNRAREAAQAAMASPLLEAGAIDGARGILINITGSSTLKLTEVNEASSLIQAAAHEDANIIFGAVLDEKMGEDVKITVIATGFRDQMPERRERMLSVQHSSVLSLPQDEVPAASVPLEASPSKSEEAKEEASEAVSEAAPVPVAEPAPPPAPRFLSQVEEAEEEPEETVELDDVDQPTYYSATAPAAKATPEPEPKQEAKLSDPPEERTASPRQESPASQPEEIEPPVVPARPRFAELSEAPSYPPHSREYAPKYTNEERRPAAPDERREQPAPARFPETNEATQPDLEKPTFLRRLGF
jgi:cell division protein FtsZ